MKNNKGIYISLDFSISKKVGKSSSLKTLELKTMVSKPLPIDVNINIDGKMPMKVPKIKFLVFILKKIAIIFAIPNGISAINL